MHRRLTSALLVLVVAAMTFAAAATGRQRATTVRVTEKEYTLMLSRSSFRAGTYTFVAMNRGKLTHALAITGPGLTHPRTGGSPDGEPPVHACPDAPTSEFRYDKPRMSRLISRGFR